MKVSYSWFVPFLEQHSGHAWSGSHILVGRLSDLIANSSMRIPCFKQLTRGNQQFIPPLMIRIFHKIYVGNVKTICWRCLWTKRKVSIIQLIRWFWNHDHHKSFHNPHLFQLLWVSWWWFLPRLSSDGVKLSTQSTAAAVTWWNDPNPGSLNNIELKTKAARQPDTQICLLYLCVI